MSASSKKKLRKEEQAAEMTDKQRREASESRKLKAYTISFVAVILVIVIAAASIFGSTMIKRSGMMEKRTIAATVDGQQLNSVEMNYFYMDAVNELRTQLNQYGSSAALYASFMGLDMSKPLDQQKYQDTEQTWADHFMDNAIEQAKFDIAMSKKATEEGLTLTEEQVSAIDATISQLDLQAVSFGVSSADKYLANVYGPGSNTTTFRAHLERSMLAYAYVSAHAESLKYTADQLRAYEADKFDNYSSFSFASYYVSSNDYLEGGTTAEDGTVTYSDEEKAAALAKAKEVADSLAKSQNAEELDKAIAALDVNKDKEKAESSKAENTFYSAVNSPIKEWLAESGRKEGDIAVLDNKVESKDENGNDNSSVMGYYVVLFQSRNDNQQPLANVRHILVKPKAAEGTSTVTDEDKAAAKKQAEEFLEQWKSGDATEDSFIALVKEKSEDEGSKENGGLIEDISPVSQLVEGFRSWAIDPARKTGDTGIVESTYGYHIMFYSGADELTYRDSMLERDLRNEDTEKWVKEITDAVTAEKDNLSRVHTDLVLATAY